MEMGCRVNQGGISLHLPPGRHSTELTRNLVKALERMEKVDVLVLDKTGTLTEGRPKLTSLVAAEGQSEEEVLRLAASLERGSEHPLAAAIVAGAEERGIALAAASDFASETGKGVRGTVAGRAVALGNAESTPKVIDALNARSETGDELVDEHVHWAIQQHQLVASKARNN